MTVSMHVDRWAPGGKFRVLVWQTKPEPKSWIEDFDTLRQAQRRTSDLGRPGECVAVVYDHFGKLRFYAPAEAAKPDMHRPMSVTKLVGMDDTDAKRGVYKRR